MPAERGMAIEDIVELLRNYDFSHQRRLSFEYIVFGGLNDSKAHAQAIVRLLHGLECRVNLIRFHQIPHVPLHAASEEKMESLPRLSHTARHLHDDPRQPWAGHLCRLWTAQHS